MPVDTKAILAEMDQLLLRYDNVVKTLRTEEYGACYDTPAELVVALMTLLQSCIDRYAPRPGYSKRAFSTLGKTPGDTQWVPTLAGVVAALRDDYANDRLKTFREMVASDVFSDFLEQAEYLFGEGHKEPAAVLAGGVLEQHIRKLCDKKGIPTTTPDPKTGKAVPIKLERLNSELARATVYGKNDQKQVTAWADIRNDAAHGKHEAYTADQVKNMLNGIRGFMDRNRA
jgi:hypothetical protein